MGRVNPKLLIALVAVILLAVFVKVSNPYREYSTRQYWETATLTSVQEVPDEALEPGNRNGGVLMWAAMGSNDPEIIAALVARGADINESDGIFKGTPLTGAAGYSANPAVIDRLVELGAEVGKLVNNGEDALMVAAQYNHHPGIVERLVHHGADPARRNAQGKTALELARENDNTVAEAALTRVSVQRAGATHTDQS